MVYAICDWIKNGDEFDKVFETGKEALSHAERVWDHMTDYDKKRRSYYAVVTVELDDDGCIDMNTAVELKVYKTEA